MQEYKIILIIKHNTHKPEKVYKYRSAKNLHEAWIKAREVCSEYNKANSHNAVIKGVVRN